MGSHTFPWHINPLPTETHPPLCLPCTSGLQQCPSSKLSCLSHPLPPKTSICPLCDLQALLPPFHLDPLTWPCGTLVSSLPSLLNHWGFLTLWFNISTTDPSTCSRICFFSSVTHTLCDFRELVLLPNQEFLRKDGLWVFSRCKMMCFFVGRLLNAGICWKIVTKKSYVLFLWAFLLGSIIATECFLLVN